MSKPFSEADFSGQIVADRTWRLKEISDLKSSIRKADPTLQRVLLRALVAICYAHWEGYVKFSSRKYLEHIALRKHQLSALDRQFMRNAFLPRLNALSQSNWPLAERCKFLDEILNFQEVRFSRVNDDLINTRSNLNFEVLSNIAIICGLPKDLLQHQSSFIDIVLLKRRNAIAHGEETFVEVADLDMVCDGTISIMRTFGDALENRVVLKQYLAA